MQEVLVHIGMHKTGSTSIQHSLRNFDDGKTRYARFKEINHSIPMFTMFSETRYNYPVWKGRGYTPEHIDTIRSEYFSILKSELDDSSRGRLIISGEDISILSETGKADLLRYLNNKDMDVRFVCFLRSPRDFAASSLQQLIRGGLRSPHAITPNYFLRLRYWSEHCKLEDLIVKDFDKEVAEYGDIVAAFAGISSIDSAPFRPIAANQSLSLSAAKLIYLLNRTQEPTFGTIERFDARQKLINIISQSFPVADAASKIDKDIVANLISLRDQELEFVRDNFDICYEKIGDPKDMSIVQSYLSNMSDVDAGTLKKTLEHLHIEYSHGDDLASMMVSMYRSLLGDLNS